MSGRFSLKRMAPFLVMVVLFGIPVLSLLLIQGSVWFVGNETKSWPEPQTFKVMAVQEDRTVLLEANDGTEIRVWIFGLDIYAPDSPLRETLFDITASELLVPNSSLACRVRAGFIYPTRNIAVCQTLVGDLGREFIVSGAADLCRRQMKFLPKELDYTTAQAETHRARLRQEVRQSEDCRVRNWATRDAAQPDE